MTRYGKLILEMIEGSREHMTAEQIFMQLKKREPKAVLATVYNNLNLLCREERIRRISVEGASDCYDRVEKHDHLVCRKCGRLSDMNPAAFVFDSPGKCFGTSKSNQL